MSTVIMTQKELKQTAFTEHLRLDTAKYKKKTNWNLFVSTLWKNKKPSEQKLLQNKMQTYYQERDS